MIPNERLDSTSMRSSERLNLKGEVIVSFFNELDTGKELCSRFQVRSLDCCFIFLMRLLQRRKLCSWLLLDHGFQEDNTLEGYHVKGQNSVMASKISSSDGRRSLWKEHMSRVVTGVRRSSSNNPIEEITMSITESKSSEFEVMGDNAT
jgi:hypothetical protein